VQVHVKGGGEGPVVFDCAIALLQGLFPPTPKNRIVLANDSVVTAPLGGYQYVPGGEANPFLNSFLAKFYDFLPTVETVEPNLDRTLESWTDCPV
jgi:lysosomal acid phosphatase